MNFYLALDELDRNNILARSTAEEAIADSRHWLSEIGNGFYDEYEDEELLELAERGELELDIVKVPGNLPKDQSPENLFRLYKIHAMGENSA